MNTPTSLPSHKILIFSPHPDDAEIGMGGTIALLVDAGWDVALVDVTNGEPTPAGSPAQRMAEANQAAAILGIKSRLCLELPNRELIPSLENRRILAEAIRRHRPDCIFTVKEPDAHPDHNYCEKLVLDARFAAKLTRTDMAGQPHWTPRVFHFWGPHLQVLIHPSFVIDVSAVWQRKISALKAYQSQFWAEHLQDRRGWIIDRVTAVARYFGDRAGVKYAEPFYSQEVIALSSLDALL